MISPRLSTNANVAGQSVSVVAVGHIRILHLHGEIGFETRICGVHGCSQDQVSDIFS